MRSLQLPAGARAGAKAARRIDRTSSRAQWNPRSVPPDEARPCLLRSRTWVTFC